NLRQITSGAACLRVGSWIADAERHGLVAIVDAHGALIRSGDCFRTWSRKTARTNHAVLNDEGQSHFVNDRRVDHAHWIGNRLTIRTNTGASLIGKGEIRELEY